MVAPIPCGLGPTRRCSGGSHNQEVTFVLRSRKAQLLAGLLVAGSVLLTPAVALAQDDVPTFDPAAAVPVGGDGFGLNLLWIVVGAALVIFMQAGFAMVETGFCRAKHAAHVVTTNLAIFGLGFVGFFVIGFSLMFGGYSYAGYFGFDEALGGKLIGFGDWNFLWFSADAVALNNIPDVLLPAVAAFFLYMVAFMDTTATIPTGSMAERWKFKSFMWWGLFCGAIYYPLFGAWTWGGGWLSQLGNNVGLGFGYVDFAGSGIVHATGGAAALAGAMVIGPRIGKFGKDGKARALPGHNIPMALLGGFILLFGWFGFNAASTFAATDVRFTIAAVNTGIAAATGLVASMVWIMKRTGKPDPGMITNGMLAGLVAITAPCAFVDPWAAAVIGLIAGVLVIEAVFFIEKRGLDDPVGAVAVLRRPVRRHLRHRRVRGPVERDRDRRHGRDRRDRDPLRPVARVPAAGRPADRRAGGLDGHVRHRLRLLQDPELPDQGRDPLLGRGRTGRSRLPGDGRRRLPR
jgi:Amt family ammonium transporter